MIEVGLQVPANASSEHVVRVTEQLCNLNGLTCTQKGTLEITWWKAKNRIWFKVAKGRMGDWMVEIIATLKKKIENSL